MDFFKGVWSWFSGGSISAALAKTALLGYVSRLLNKSTGGGVDNPSEPDKGVRLQLNPSTENQIPVLYGSAYFGGNITDAALSSDYKKMTYCLTLAEVTGEKLSTGTQTSYTFNNVYMNNNRVVFKADGFTVDYTLDASGNQDISMRDLVKVYFYKGTTPIQPVGKSGTTPASHTVMPGWTALTHPMSNLLYAIVEVNYNRDKNVTGLPDCQFHITSDMTLAGDCLVDYMLSTRYGAGIDVSEIDTSFAALNTFCAAGFTYTNLSGQSTNSQITINGVVDTNKSLLDNMEEMAKAASSWITYDIHSGKWTTIINQAGSSVASFSDSNIIGDISISGTSLTQLSNAADVKYQNTDILDKTDFVKIEIPEVDLFQNEPRSTLQLSLPYTNKQVVATKIGLQELKQARIDKIISFRADYSYINLRAGELIDVTNTIYGFTNKVFRIVTVSEVENDNGSLEVEIKALEYDADVYAYTIQQYNVTTDSGILSIGAIGKPNTPSITKTEQANVPKIQIDAVVPSGIVDSIEYWITFDVAVSNDSARTYIQIGRYQNTNGTVLTEDDLVSYTYSGLGQGDFYVKVRGVNNVTTGPFSDPSGLIQYRPVVVADTVSDEPVSIGGQLMGLGLLTLLNNLDKLFSGDSAAGGLFDKIFEVFSDVTGVDLVGQASGGTLVVAGSGLIDGLTDVDTTTNPPTEGDVLTWDGTNWVPSSASGGGGGGGTVGPCYLDIDYYYPSDRATQKLALPQNESDRAPISGNYFFSVSGSLSAPPTKGTGSIKLYKSNGTLVQTLQANNLIIENNIVKVPFSDRELGVDYYVLMDAGVVTYGNCKSPAITTPTGWNFHTGVPKVVPTPNPKPLAPAPAGCPNASLIITKYITESLQTSAPQHTKVYPQSYVGVQFNYPVVLQSSGTITVKNSFGLTFQTINLADTFATNKVSELVWVSGNTLYVNVTKDYTNGITYYLNMTANCVKDSCGLYGNTAITDSQTIRWTVDGGPAPAQPPFPADKPISETGLNLGYDRTVVPGTGTMEIKDANGNVIKTVAATDPAVSIKEDY